MESAEVVDNNSNTDNDQPKSAADLLNTAVFTIDPKLDNLASKNTLSPKAATAKKIFSNYRKNQR